MNIQHRRPTTFLATALLLGACAPGTPFAAADPSVATASVEVQPYRSPFAGQPRFETVEPRSWRETNDLVGRLGGPGPHMRASEGETAGAVVE